MVNPLRTVLGLAGVVLQGAALIAIERKPPSLTLPRVSAARPAAEAVSAVSVGWIPTRW